MTVDADVRVPRGMYAGIFLISLAVLMLQVLLTRIFSFTIWYHLAYLTISTALLGFGAAGSLLAGFPGWRSRSVPRLCALCSAGAGIFILVALVFVAPRPINPQDMTVTPLKFTAELCIYYAILAVPFILAGIAVAAPLSAYPARVNRLYATDLSGAALGCLIAAGSLIWLTGPQAVVVCVLLFLASGVAYAGGGALRVVLAMLCIAAAGTVPFSDALLKFKPTISKVMGYALTLPGTEILFSKWSPVNRVDVIKDEGSIKGYTFWAGNGIGPAYRGPRPGGYQIQYDGHNGSIVYKINGPDAMQMLDEHILRTPYLLVDKPAVLIIGVGGGIDVLNALRRQSRSVTAVELQPITVDLLKNRFTEWTNGEFHRPELNLVAAEGRHYVRSHPEQVYDLVQVTMTDTFSAQSTGAYVLAESYLYTVEAFDDYFSHLSENGVLSFVLGDLIYDQKSIPPAMATRLALAARQSLEKLGVKDTERHIAFVSQINIADKEGKAAPVTVTEYSSNASVIGSTLGDVLIKKSPFTDAEIKTLQDFAARNGFKVDVVPGQPDLSPMSALVHTPTADLPAALRKEVLNVYPATDDRPFFYHVLPWRTIWTGERILWAYPGSTTGQLVLLMMLAQSIVLGSILIFFPLLRGARENLSSRKAFSFLFYFLSLGIGFMLIEISFVQKYILLLGYPTYSLSVTVCSLLIFTALGAALSRRFWNLPKRVFLLGLLSATILLVLAEIAVLPSIRQASLGASLPIRIVITAVLQAPIGVCLGMYFTTGIEILRVQSPRLVPWAWAINGIGSVLSTVLAVILAMGIGFSGVSLVALAVYTAGVLAVLPAARVADAARA